MSATMPEKLSNAMKAAKRFWGIASHADTGWGWIERLVGWGLLGGTSGGGAAVLFNQSILQAALYGLGVAWLILVLAVVKRRGWIRSSAVPSLIVVALAFVSWQQGRLQETLECYVFPRSLSDKQMQTITDYLLPYENPPDVKFRVMENDPEASEYRSYFHRAILAANWRVSGINYFEGMSPGFRVRYQQSFEIRDERRNRRPQAPPTYGDEILIAGFGAAGISAGGGGGSSRDTEGYDFWIEVGPRPLRFGSCIETDDN